MQVVVVVVINDVNGPTVVSCIHQPHLSTIVSHLLLMHRMTEYFHFLVNLSLNVSRFRTNINSATGNRGSRIRKAAPSHTVHITHPSFGNLLIRFLIHTAICLCSTLTPTAFCVIKSYPLCYNII